MRGPRALHRPEARGGVNSTSVPESLSAARAVAVLPPWIPGRQGLSVRRPWALAVLLAVAALAFLAPPVAAFPATHEPSLDLMSYGFGDVVVADVNGDGGNDIAWTYRSGNGLYIHYRSRSGFPVDPDRRAEVSGPSALAAADIDGDGAADLAVLSERGAELFLDLVTEPLFPAYVLGASSGVDLALGDVNGDSRVDLVVLTTDSLLVWLQDSRGAYDAAASVRLAAPGFRSLTLGDVDGDFRADVILATPSWVRVLAFRESGPSPQTLEYATEWHGDDIAILVGDLNLDGRADLAIAKSDASSVAIAAGRIELWFQTAGGLFTAGTPFEGPLTARFLLRDLNDDGDLDVAAIRADGDVAVYFQIGGGTFSPETPERLVGAEPGIGEVLAAGDANGDTYADLVLRGRETGSLRIFLQDDLQPAVTGLQVPSTFVLNEGATASTGWSLATYLHDDHARLTYEVERVSGVGIEARVDEGILGFRAPEGVVGRAVFRVHAADGVPEHPAVVTNEFLVTANAVPRITSYPPTTFQVGEESLYLVTYEDGFPEEEAHRLVVVDAPPGVSVDPRGRALRWTPTADQVGVHGITIRVEDSNGGRSAPQSFAVAVQAVPPPPAPPSALPAVVAGGTVAALGAVGAGAAVSENLRWSLLGFFLPLYSKIKREDVLDHFVRGQIYGYVLANPGEHYNGIKQALHLTNGSLAHHLKTLEREEFVRSRRFGLYRRFYPQHFKIPEGDAFFPNHIQRSLLTVVAAEPGMSQKELSMRLGLTPPTVNYHVGILAEHGFVRVLHSGRKTQLYALGGDGTVGGASLG